MFWVWFGCLGLVSGTSTTGTLASIKPSLQGSLSCKDNSSTLALQRPWLNGSAAAAADAGICMCMYNLYNNSTWTSGTDDSWEFDLPTFEVYSWETVLWLLICFLVSLVVTCWLGQCLWMFMFSKENLEYPMEKVQTQTWETCEDLFLTSFVLFPVCLFLGLLNF